MKRDMELIRKILLQVETAYNPTMKAIRDFQVSGYEKCVIDAHLKLMEQAGFFEKIVWATSLGTPDTAVTVSNLTNSGYDYLDKIRDDGTWQKTLKTIADKGLDMSIKTIGTIASAFVTAATEGVVNSILKNGGNV